LPFCINIFLCTALIENCKNGFLTLQKQILLANFACKSTEIGTMTLIKSISGIRGTIGDNKGEYLNPIEIAKFSSAFGTFTKQRSKKDNPKLIIGRDARISGIMVNNIIVGSLIGCGINVIDIGLASTPTVEIAVTEENAAGGKIVTAPTCGSSGVVPAVLKYLQESFSFSDDKILRALATAGLIGNIVKENASISGAKVGCQGEIGTACAMASAAATQLLGGTPNQIEYAAEMGIEHHLGLTCDPINGLVQVPCIERNAFAAERALNTSTYALLSDGRHLVSFDKIVKTMNQTGHDLPSIYKETSEGGMALLDI